MQAENLYLKPLLRRDNKISQGLINKKQIEKKIKEKDKALGEKDKMITDLAKTLKENNISIEIIMEKTKLSKKEIEKL